MSVKKIIIFAVLLGLALAYIFLSEIPRNKASALAGKIFSSLSRRSIESIEIAAAGATFTIRNGKPAHSGEDLNSPIDSSTLPNWSFADVAGAELDQGALNSLLSAIVDFDFSEPIEPSEVDSDLGLYGLKDPTAKVSIKSGEFQDSIQFGKKNDYVGKRYARREKTGQLGLVDEALFAAASKSKADYRNRTPIQFLDSDIKEIALARKSFGTTKLISTGEGHWRLLEPISAMGRDSAVSDLARELRGISVAEFLDSADPNSTSYGLGDPDATVTLTYQDQKKSAPLVIKIKKVGGGKLADGSSEEIGAFLSLSGRSGVFKTSQDVLSFVSKDANSFREKQYLKFSTDQVLSAEFSGQDISPTKINLDKGAWKINDKPGDTIFIKDFLKTISDLQAADYPTQDADYGFTEPRLRVKIQLSNAKPGNERTLVVGKEAQFDGKSGYFAAVDDLKEPFIITQDSFKKILPREEVLLRPEPTPVAKSTELNKEGAGEASPAHKLEQPIQAP